MTDRATEVQLGAASRERRFAPSVDTAEAQHVREHIAQVVASAPALAADQKDRLVLLLRPTRKDSQR